MITYPKTDFSEVAHRIRSGDEAAYTEFFNELYKTVFRRAFALLKNYADAEDATQAVFIKLWRNRSKWEPDRGDFLGWFLILAERTLIDEYRKQQRLLRAEVTSFETPFQESSEDETLTLSDVLADNKIDALDAMILNEKIAAIESALIQLTPAHRLTFYLYYFEEYSLIRITEIMRCSYGTSKIRIHRARRQIIEILETGQLPKSKDLGL